ncbi:unnamed protein product [Rangifer tarandus platyrhynchus]|uniref:Uncharacterized protein n=1 Tax=Rangifer tarandus platyrhynchus TaxID=3082113 RepID=A0ABN8Y3B5_RANTA|nr:unnamed protein product [Rangifer tarandus platyrhynchus]
MCLHWEADSSPLSYRETVSITSLSRRTAWPGGATRDQGAAAAREGRAQPLPAQGQEARPREDAPRQGEQQRLRFAGAAVKRHPASKVYNCAKAHTKSSVRDGTPRRETCRFALPCRELPAHGRLAQARPEGGLIRTAQSGPGGCVRAVPRRLHAPGPGLLLLLCGCYLMILCV